MAEIRIEHRYPRALVFLREHGPEAFAVLHDLLAHTDRRGDELVVEASVREVAERLGLAKDTVHRRLRRLIRARVLRRVPGRSRRGARVIPCAYAINLDDTGINVTTTNDDQTI